MQDFRCMQAKHNLRSNEEKRGEQQENSQAQTTSWTGKQKQPGRAASPSLESSGTGTFTVHVWVERHANMLTSYEANGCRAATTALAVS